MSSHVRAENKTKAIFEAITFRVAELSTVIIIALIVAGIGYAMGLEFLAGWALMIVVFLVLTYLFVCAVCFVTELFEPNWYNVSQENTERQNLSDDAISREYTLRGGAERDLYTQVGGLVWVGPGPEDFRDVANK